ncbi:hypothetical protein BDY19DRAFT_295883 [Irpex rosettiformis]|uniref:Uncharacterized protein n=1 Tax=Irpex rosettiformis TaxID=378272 RepID=A0ACB8UJ02_9APHY|nr:hypothetical protein BDY19DRAFT_295883 [Irpex rosettiformis]
MLGCAEDSVQSTTAAMRDVGRDEHWQTTSTRCPNLGADVMVRSWTSYINAASTRQCRQRRRWPTFSDASNVVLIMMLCRSTGPSLCWPSRASAAVIESSTRQLSRFNSKFFRNVRTNDDPQSSFPSLSWRCVLRDKHVLKQKNIRKTRPGGLDSTHSGEL